MQLRFEEFIEQNRIQNDLIPVPRIARSNWAGIISTVNFNFNLSLFVTETKQYCVYGGLQTWKLGQ